MKMYAVIEKCESKTLFWGMFDSQEKVKEFCKYLIKSISKEYINNFYIVTNNTTEIPIKEYI